MSPVVITGGPSVETIGLILDPDGSSVDLNDGSLYRLTAIDLPEPPLKTIYSGNFDTEGSLPAAEHGYENREINLTLLVFAADPVSLRALVATLNEKEGKINRESRGGQAGGVLRMTLPDDMAIDFDLLEAKATSPLRHEFFTHSRTEITLTFIAKPFWRGTEVDLGTFSETTLPCLTAVLPVIEGDVPALGRMLITDLSANSQWWVRWGVQSRFYDAAAIAALFKQAEDLTPLGGAATAVGATGASGAGSNVVRQGTLTTNWQVMLSTQASGGGAHLSHVGSFEVLARVYTPSTNGGEVSLALEWAQGDFTQRETNDPVDLGGLSEGTYMLVSLGQVHLREAVQGTQRWEGRIIAMSTTTGDDLDIDCLMLIPLIEGGAELAATRLRESPTAFSARDEFDQVVTGGSDPLTGLTLPVGGTWAGAGDSDDFVVEDTGHTAQRTAVSDATTGRFALAGSTNYAAITAQVDVKISALPSFVSTGLVLRYVDTSNYLAAVINWQSTSGTAYLQASKIVAGTPSDLGVLEAATVRLASATPGEWWTVRATVDTAGRVWVWAFPQGSVLGWPTLAGYDPVLATGGVLDDGKVGFYDEDEFAGAVTRNYDNFMAFVPTSDAAIFASQSLELRHDYAEREDAAGAVWTNIKPEGDHFKLAPAGAEGRVNRLIVKASRNAPGLGDPAIDDLQVQVFATPRGVSVP